MKFSSMKCVAFARLTLTPGEVELVSANILALGEDIGSMIDGMLVLDSGRHIRDSIGLASRQESVGSDFAVPGAVVPSFGTELPQVG